MAEQQGAETSQDEASEWKPLVEFCQNAMPMESFLPLAVNLTFALMSLHRKVVVHRHLSPEDIWVCLPTWQVALDQPRALAASSAKTPDTAPLKLALPYMAPEQSGRINQRLDLRSDGYSLGVIFYQLLTGTLPFAASDPLELLHAHVARIPSPPHEVNPEVPPALSAIVMKLLAKPMEARYQSMGGLHADLLHCLTQWQSGGTIDLFPLGTRDVSESLHFPRRLYGRAAELQNLVDTYERVVERGVPELVLLTGSAGIGKSALAAELEKAVLMRGGAFSAGKFDQYKRHMPYVTLGEALCHHIQTLLAGSDMVVSAWRDKLTAAVGNHGALVLELIPQAGLLLEPPPPLPPLPSKEAQRRLLNTLSRFIVALATADCPLVLFLDDLQWSDPASLSLLQYLLQHADARYLLVVGAYRDAEVSASHPLTEMLDALRQGRMPVTDLHVGPLTIKHFGYWLEDTLHAPLRKTMPLARLLHLKTGGNPFFAIQFLKRLVHEGWVHFEPEELRWRWNLKEIKAQGYTDNVIDLMIDNLRRLLPADTLALLQLAACVGQRGKLALLARLHNVGAAEALREDLQEALAAGFVELTADDGYQFTHDRIQQAVYTLMPNPERARTHLRIGREMLAQMPDRELDEYLFDIANQLNAGAALLTAGEEIRRVAELNLRAARKAKESSAFASAADYACRGASLLPFDCWKDHYELAFSLHLACAEAVFLGGNLPQAEQRLAALMPRAADNCDAAAVARVQVQLHAVQGQIAKAMTVGIECLQRFGMNIPLHPAPEQAQAECEQVWRQLGDRPIQALLDAPRMLEPEALAAQELLLLLAEWAFHIDRELYALLVCRTVNLILKHGNSDSSSILYVNFGVLLQKSFGMYEQGFQFGKLAVALTDKFGSASHKIRVKYTFGFWINPWKRPFREIFDYLPDPSEAIAIGDFATACFLYVTRLGCLRLQGKPLATLYRESERALDFVRKVHFEWATTQILALQRFILSLHTQTHSRSISHDADTEQTDFEAYFKKSSREFATFECVYSLRKLEVNFLFGNHAEALVAAAQVQKTLWSILSLPQQADYYYFHALVLAAQPGTTAGAQHAARLSTLRAHQAKLRNWVEHCPENFLNKYALVSAEIARLEGDDPAALRLYDQAIRAAHDNGFAEHEAIACELEAKFLLARGLDASAASLLRSARACYRRWGADIKIAQLEREFAAALAPDAAEAEASAAPMLAERIELLAVAKAAQSISSEVMPNRLHEALMRVVLEQVGAQSGQLLLAQNGDLQMQARASFTADGYRVESMHALSVDSGQAPVALLNYVRHTREPLILEDAGADLRYAQDDYIQRWRPRSVLCMPILRHERLIGILYLENYQSPGAFDAVNLEVLEVLVSQMAISLENASLYLNLQESEARLAAVVDNSPALIYIKDLDGRYLFANHPCEVLLGLKSDELRGRSDYDVLPKEVADRLRAADRRAISDGHAVTFEETVPQADGSMVTYLSVKVPLFRDGHIYGVCGISLDISEQKHTRERLAYLAHYDALTGLANRVLLADHLNLALASAKRRGLAVAVLFLDLDRFKIVNDSLGHRVGDLLLQEVADRLRACVREVDTVARLAGDEFVVVITDLAAPEIARQSAQKLIQAISRPHRIEGQELQVGTSIGISLFPQDAQEPEVLLQHADLAMYHAKSRGRKTFQFFSPTLNARAQERLALENSLRLAQERGELFLHYQPQVSLASRKIVGAEALIRWRHPQRGLVSPAKFIPVAEDSGLIVEISHWVLTEACCQARRWQQMGLPPITVAVNISALSFQHDNLDASVAEALRVSGLEAQHLELELTEGILMSEVDSALNKLDALKRLGVVLAIDDFGTGYSSLSYLKRFAVDKLKIDQSFVRDITHDPDDAAITRTIISMAKHLRLRVIAEGVEDIGAERFLREHRCDEMQGYLISPPVSADAFADLLRN